LGFFSFIFFLSCSAAYCFPTAVLLDPSYASLPIIDRVLIPSAASTSDTRLAIAAAQQALNSNSTASSVNNPTALPPVGGLPARGAVLASLGVPVSQYTFDTLARLQHIEDRGNARRSTPDAKERRRKRKLARKIERQAAAKPNPQHAYKGDDGAAKQRRCGKCGGVGHNARRCIAAVHGAVSPRSRKRTLAPLASDSGEDGGNDDDDDDDDNDNNNGDDNDNGDDGDNGDNGDDGDDKENDAVPVFASRSARDRPVKPNTQFADFMI
jgi:hypothetical protein